MLVRIVFLGAPRKHLTGGYRSRPNPASDLDPSDVHIAYTHTYASVRTTVFSHSVHITSITSCGCTFVGDDTRRRLVHRDKRCDHVRVFISTKRRCRSIHVVKSIIMPLSLNEARGHPEKARLGWEPSFFTFTDQLQWLDILHAIRQRLHDLTRIFLHPLGFCRHACR